MSSTDFTPVIKSIGDLVKSTSDAVANTRNDADIEREKRDKEARISIDQYEYDKKTKRKETFKFVETFKYNSDRGEYDKIYVILEKDKEIYTYNVDQTIRNAGNKSKINEQINKDRDDIEKSVKALNEDEKQKLIKKQNAVRNLNNLEATTSSIKSSLNESRILNVSALIEDKVPFFTKSYYAFDSLTPYIRCYIKTPELKLLNNKETIKSIEKNYFEIPYNLVKSLEIEFDAAPGVASKFTLKLEDSTGIIGNIIVAQLYSLGILKEKDGMPKLNIEFGWADKHLKKLTKKQMENLYYKNFFSEYMITDSDIEFSEKFKQEVILKGHQDQVGIDRMSYLNGNDFGPYHVIGRSPVESLRILQYYHYFIKNKDNNYGLNIFPDKTGETSVITKFIKQPKITTQQKNKTEADENFLISVCKQENNFFNHLLPTHTDCNEVKESFKPFTTKTTFHPYLIFCYILNKYIVQVKDFYKKKINVTPDEKTPEIFYLCYFDEKNIKGFEPPRGNFDDYCAADVKSGTKKRNGFEAIGSDILIQDNEVWGSLLQRIASKVKLKSKDDKQAEPSLYIEINRFIPLKTTNSKIREYDKEFKDISLKNFPLEILINKFNKIIQFYEQKKDGKNNEVVKKIKNQIEKLEKLTTFNKPIIYIIITAGSPFLTEDNYPEKPVLQSYTVFPKINSDNRLEYQNFDSGSVSLADASYPDVISFRPKINLKNIINANFKTENPINYNNGIVKFENKKFYIKDQNSEEQKSLSKNILSLISAVRPSSTENKIILLSYKQSFYSINDSRVYFFHEKISASYGAFKEPIKIDIGKTQNNTKIKEIFADLANELETYDDNLKVGYHFSVLNSLIKKSKRIFPGDNNMADFYAYANSANEYNKLLNIGAKGFEAELKILGEPAFAYDFGPLSYILMNVNNFDGSPNYLLSGIYSLKKIKHNIENGKFETTITLMYDSPWGT